MSKVEVHITLTNTQPILAGTLYSHLRHGREGSSFRYASSYLANPDAYALEPAMPLASGDFAFPRGLPHSFRDASPDRWGRLLIEKGLKQQWLATATPPRTITEIDYLLGTSDLTRQGVLRFKRPDSTTFEAPGAEAPKLMSLASLLAAANKLCTNSDGDDADAAVKALLEAGTGSLGGARPKSSVVDENNQGHKLLYVAKFPHPADKWDIMRWEKIALDLAARAGIKVPENRLLSIEGANVLLLRRFDRHPTGQRIGYMSAMTLLENEEGRTRDYLELADALSEISVEASADLAQLWRRIIFSLALNNTDDHLRNHGILRSGNGWCLSPAFDINPNPDLHAQRVTTIGGAASFEDGWQAASEAREWFGLSKPAATQIKTEVINALRQGEYIARQHGATKEELRRFAPIIRRALSKT